LGKTIALRFEIVRFLKKPALYALKTLNFKLTLPSLAVLPSYLSDIRNFVLSDVEFLWAPSVFSAFYITTTYCKLVMQPFGAKRMLQYCLLHFLFTVEDTKSGFLKTKFTSIQISV
jgi:hypothetical protein